MNRHRSLLRRARLPVAAGTLLALGLILVAPGARSQVSTPDPRATITRVLDDQTLAWNRGDLDGFLDGYWRSPQVVFQSGGNRLDGFDAMRERYRKRYGGDSKTMGQLAFTGLEVEPLGVDAAFVRGRYTLTMLDGSHPTGLFTLILRRIDGQWKIIHDHTSAAEASAAPAKPESPG